MFETKTYEALLASALARVSSGIDKREGSMVMNGVAPSMAELAQLYIGLDFVFTATYLATAPREYLIKRAADRNMSPYLPSAAVFRAEFNIEVPVGTRFSSLQSCGPGMPLPSSPEASLRGNHEIQFLKYTVSEAHPGYPVHQKYLN